jgi:O-antigen/teichoic acid export membrane protein
MEIITKENSHKTIIKATGIFGFAQALKIVVSLIGSKFVAIFLGPVGIGTVGLLNNTISIIASVTSFGFTITGVREVSLAHSENDQIKFSKRFIVLQRWSLLIGLLGALLTIILSKLLSKWTFGTSEYYFWFVILSVNFVFLSLTNSKISLLQGLRMIKPIAISSLISSVLITIVTIPIYYFFKFDGIVAVILFSSAISFLVNSYFTRNIKINKINISIVETFKSGIPLIKMGFLLSINIIFGQICNYLIKLYLNGNGSTAEILGLFEVSSVFLISYVGLIFNAMGTDFYPRLTAIQSDNSKVRELVNDQIEIGLLLITPAIAFLYFGAPLLIQVLYTKDFLGVLLIFKAALFAVIIKAIIWPLGFIILAKGENKLYFKQELLGDFLNISFTILLFHLLGLEGIGIATLINYIFYGFYVFRIVNKKFNFGFRNESFKIMFISCIIGLLSCIITFFIDYPYAYYPLGLIFIFSILYSYKELDKRVDLFSYYLKIKNKFKGIK